MTDAVINVSTSAQIAYVVLNEAFAPVRSFGRVEFVPYTPSQYLASAASLNGGNVLDAFVKTLQQWTLFLMKPASTE